MDWSKLKAVRNYLPVIFILAIYLFVTYDSAGWHLYGGWRFLNALFFVGPLVLLLPGIFWTCKLGVFTRFIVLFVLFFLGAILYQGVELIVFRSESYTNHYFWNNSYVYMESNSVMFFYILLIFILLSAFVSYSPIRQLRGEDLHNT